jgi:hypothetical protein
MKTTLGILAGFGVTLWSVSVGAAPVTFSAAGDTPASIQATVDAYRDELGALNPNVPGSLGAGRREINWDGVSDSFAAPNNLPGDFFNVNSPRGVVFSTPGTGFQVSADSSNPTSTPIEFGDIDPNYPNFFETFSAQRLFTSLGSNLFDVSFFIPGSTTPALTTGFGAVFTDVDSVNTSSLQFFDAANDPLGTFFVPAVAGNQTLSFLGILFTEGAVVSRVRVTSGNQVLAPGNTDVSVVDDFLYGEPRLAQVPEPATLLLLAMGLVALAAFWLRAAVPANRQRSVDVSPQR